MFWGKNIKSGETVVIGDSENEGKYLNIRSANLVNGDEQKYILSIIYKKETFQLLTFDSKHECYTPELTFEIEKGMKLKLEGGKKGYVSITGNVEALDGEGGEQEEKKEMQNESEHEHEQREHEREHVVEEVQHEKEEEDIELDEDEDVIGDDGDDGEGNVEVKHDEEKQNEDKNVKAQ